MPAAPQVSYPGVYIQEVPSDVHTITPVDTATTAFIGLTERGPVNQPVVINGLGDFQRIFGGLWSKSKLGFAVQDFFRNGGSKAVIVRVAKADTAKKATASLPAGALVLEARNEGAWGNSINVRVVHTDPTDPFLAKTAKRYSVAPTDLFDLVIHDASTGSTESWTNLTLVPGPRQIATVLGQGSQLVQVATNVTVGRIDKTPDAGIDFKDGADGGPLAPSDIQGNAANKTGLFALEGADIFNLLCIPPFNDDDVGKDVWDAAISYCTKRRAMVLIDPPSSWTSKDKVTAANALAAVATADNHAALFFPRLIQPNPLLDNQADTFVPCGVMAGVIARTDGSRGVWKAPAGIEARLLGVTGLSVPMTDAENGELNPLGVNCLRTMPAAGYVAWGARTLEGDDRLASQWKYIPVRRTALFIEESLYRGSQWAVFEPNDEPLWAQLRLNIGAFMQGLFRQGAFQGKSPNEAYFVKCDSTTTSQADINRGIVNVVIGFAPLKPAEFVVLYIQQIAGQLPT